MFSFLAKTVLISLSGVMAPGAVTAATLAQGSRSRWAGVWIALGHGIVEIPLIFILVFWVNQLVGSLGKDMPYYSSLAKIIIGSLGGLFLLYLGIQSLREIAHPGFSLQNARSSRPMITGIVLSATNPYFLGWWVAVGLGLALQAKGMGITVLWLFALVHWTCDLIWLVILSFTAFHGTAFLNIKTQKYILAFCGLAMSVFGLMFIYDAIKVALSLSVS